jgi:hypothetical protein
MSHLADPAKMRHKVRAAYRAYDKACASLRTALRDRLTVEIAYHEALGPRADQKRLTRLRAHLALTYRHPQGMALNGPQEGPPEALQAP